MNSMKPMLCNNKQTNKTKTKTKKASAPPPPPIPLTHANSPRVRSYLARATAGQVQWFTWQWCTWPIAGPQTLFVRREHTDSFRVYNLFTSSMQERHPRPSFMNCPYHALTGVLTGACYATGKGGLRPVTLLLLVSGRGNQRERERERDGLA